MSKPKYDVDNEIFCYNYKKEKVKGIISMITINRKGIRYRVKVGYDNQEEVWEDDVIGIAVAKDDSESPCRKCLADKASCCGCTAWREWKLKQEKGDKHD